MYNHMKTAKPTKALLQARIKDLDAQLASSAHFLDIELEKACVSSLAGSGVVLELRLLGGKTLGVPCFIRDGLSKETIASLRRDLATTYELATVFKPSGVK